ncbi:MAG: peptidoglycan-binding protein [Clostridia bacterium]|nr:peptidoglycan-binding protein [Clostridia bacterium]
MRQLQTRLYQLRYLDAEYITGIFSDNTVAALMIFQQRHGLQADGVAGPLTLQTLYSMQAGVFMQGE